MIECNKYFTKKENIFDILERFDKNPSEMDLQIFSEPTNNNKDGNLDSLEDGNLDNQNKNNSDTDNQNNNQDSKTYTEDDLKRLLNDRFNAGVKHGIKTNEKELSDKYGFKDLQEIDNLIQNYRIEQEEKDKKENERLIKEQKFEEYKKKQDEHYSKLENSYKDRITNLENLIKDYKTNDFLDKILNQYPNLIRNQSLQDTKQILKGALSVDESGKIILKSNEFDNPESFIKKELEKRTNLFKSNQTSGFNMDTGTGTGHTQTTNPVKNYSEKSKNEIFQEIH